MRRSSLIEIRAQVVVFDLDDTLYLERDFARSGFRAISSQFGNRVGGEDFAKACTELLAEGTRGNIFDLALTRVGIEATPRLIGELVSHYRTHAPDIEFCEDASRFIQRMDDMPTGLITDGPKEAQWAKITALGLDRMLDHIVVTGEWPKEFSKPHTRAFELIQQQTNSAPRDIVYIADNGAKDFVAPRQLGWQSVQILRTGRIHSGSPVSADHEADHVISSLDELTISPRGEGSV